MKNCYILHISISPSTLKRLPTTSPGQQVCARAKICHNYHYPVARLINGCHVKHGNHCPAAFRWLIIRRVEASCMTSRLCSGSCSSQCATMTIWPATLTEISWTSWGHSAGLWLNATCWWSDILTLGCNDNPPEIVCNRCFYFNSCSYSIVCHKMNKVHFVGRFLFAALCFNWHL